MTQYRSDQVTPWYCLIPFDKGGKSGLDRYLRLEAEIAAGGFYIRVTCRHVAELHRQQPLYCRPAEHSLEHTDKIEQLLRAVIAEIVDPVLACCAPVDPPRR